MRDVLSLASGSECFSSSSLPPPSKNAINNNRMYHVSKLIGRPGVEEIPNTEITALFIGLINSNN
ncbi:hypothetical protein KIN20_009984 [Parelaphostrongylus tenuis]|uniref:Uncharacterized protein n=1 Tax=Parelaphostrongylus tenuis TaxID=148309 RepID=A0AAD5MRB5_PARTN|nr:hypothetical protein KIN20_009984 [Parelaphostrongylus tenuis]